MIKEKSSFYQQYYQLFVATQNLYELRVKKILKNYIIWDKKKGFFLHRLG